MGKKKEKRKNFLYFFNIYVYVHKIFWIFMDICGNCGHIADNSKRIYFPPLFMSRLQNTDIIVEMSIKS